MWPEPARQHGLSLVELMISITLGLLLVAGITTLFVQTKRSSTQNQALQGLQDQARFALLNLTRDLSMAGYWGGMFLSRQIDIAPAALAALPAANDCSTALSANWALDARGGGRVDAFNAEPDRQAGDHFGCLENARLGADAFGIRRVAGERTAQTTTCAPLTLRANHFYLKTNGDAGGLIFLPAALTLPCTAPDPLAGRMDFYKWMPRIYYVRDHARTPGDRIPTLCRRELQHRASPAMEDECLAEGVEDLQIVWGLDLVVDGVADRYSSTPTALEMQRAVSAQVFLLVRASSADLQYQDLNTYQYADRVGEDRWVRPADEDESGLEPNQRAVHFQRELFSTTIKIRNPLPQ